MLACENCPHFYFDERDGADEKTCHWDSCYPGDAAPCEQEDDTSDYGTDRPDPMTENDETEFMPLYLFNRYLKELCKYISDLPDDDELEQMYDKRIYIEFNGRATEIPLDAQQFYAFLDYIKTAKELYDA